MGAPEEALRSTFTEVVYNDDDATSTAARMGDPDSGGARAHRALWEQRVPREHGEPYDAWKRRIREAREASPVDTPRGSSAKTEKLNRQGVIA